MSPPVVGILMSPPTRPSMGVLIIVCAMSGPAETAKPVATLEAMNPRRENLTFGSRLLNSGLVGARSFIEFLRRGVVGGLAGAVRRTDSASFLFPQRATRRGRGAARSGRDPSNGPRRGGPILCAYLTSTCPFIVGCKLQM